MTQKNKCFERGFNLMVRTLVGMPFLQCLGYTQLWLLTLPSCHWVLANHMGTLYYISMPCFSPAQTQCLWVLRE